MDLATLIQTASSVGFPVFCAIWFIWRDFRYMSLLLEHSAREIEILRSLQRYVESRP
jgi:hypothetical protein